MPLTTRDGVRLVVLVLVVVVVVVGRVNSLAV